VDGAGRKLVRSSTHIIKPEPLGAAVKYLIQTEDWALRVALDTAIGSGFILPADRAEILELAGATYPGGDS
jgi:hypothetical protein